MLFYLAACALGLLAGAAFAWTWLRFVPAGTQVRFWSQMRTLAFDMLRTEDVAALASQYGRLGRLLGGYLARNLGATVAGCLPLAAILLTVGPLIFNAWDARAQHVRLIPSDAAAYVKSAGHSGGKTAYCTSEGYCALFAALDFDHVVELPSGTRGPRYAVLRADHGDRNPFWPFLSDLEATLFASFALSTLAGIAWPRAPKS